jgi:Uma2 family endonuclease
MAQLRTSRIVPSYPEELHSGDRMTREEFHRIYEKMPEGFKAELVGGIVYVSPPLRVGHSDNHVPLVTLFFAYEGNTPGVHSGDNATVLLGDVSQPQPDVFMRIQPDFGGRSKTSGEDYIEGPPELVAEIAHSTQAIDLHAKKQDYMRHGILEYLVLSLKERQLKWFDLRADKELTADADGVCRVRVFPGLWIHVEGLLSRNYTASTF